MLRAEGVHHAYPSGSGTAPVLRGLDIAVARGERVGLGGPSGCGKSTLARILALLEAPDRGRVMLDGALVTGTGLALAPAVRRRVHLLWQAPRPAVDPRHRLRRIIAEPLRIHPQLGAGDHQVVDVARRVGLTDDLLERLPNEVSDGQLQRACVARALLLRPDVLIADELGAMLDVSTQAAILAVLAEEVAAGMGVVLVSHDATLLRHWCDRTMRLRAGRLESAGC